MERARLASGWPPSPTPASGCERKTLAVSSILRERSLVTCFVEWRPTDADDQAGAEERDDQSGHDRDSRSVRFPATKARKRVTTKRAAMLDCEYENQSPAKRTPAIASAR